MVYFFVVLEHPCAGDFTHFIEIPEQRGIEHLVSIRTIEAFDKGVLIRLPWFDLIEHDAIFFATACEHFAQKFRTIVIAK